MLDGVSYVQEDHCVIAANQCAAGKIATETTCDPWSKGIPNKAEIKMAKELEVDSEKHPSQRARCPTTVVVVCRRR